MFVDRASVKTCIFISVKTIESQSDLNCFSFFATLDDSPRQANAIGTRSEIKSEASERGKCWPTANVFCVNIMRVNEGKMPREPAFDNETRVGIQN